MVLYMVQDKTRSISKNRLKGKSVSYVKDGAYYDRKVIRIRGKTLTVIDGNKTRIRIHPNNEMIRGVWFRNKLVDIKW